MVSVGDEAPTFTAPVANGDVGTFSLSEQLGDGPVVLAFFPAAFTGTCRAEMRTFQDRLAAFADAGASVYGVSIDTPFSLNEFRRKNGVEFPIVSDSNREVVTAYGVAMDMDDHGVANVAKRSVFVLDDDGVVVYRWVSDDPTVEPDYDAVLSAAAEA